MKTKFRNGLRIIGNRLLTMRDRLLRMSRKKLIGLVSGIVVLAVVLGLGISIFVWSQRNVPDTYDDIAAHYKYGSFGGVRGVGERSNLVLPRRHGARLRGAARDRGAGAPCSAYRSSGGDAHRVKRRLSREALD